MNKVMLQPSIGPVRQSAAGLRVWHKVDTLHKTPKLFTFFQLCGPVCPETSLPLLHATPKASAANSLLITILEDVLTEESYMAEMAGLKCSVSSGYSGVEFRFSGFSEKLPILAKKVFETFIHLEVWNRSHNKAFISVMQIAQRVFDTMKEDLIRRSENVNMKVRAHSAYTRVYTLSPQQWHNDEILKELRLLTPQDLQVAFFVPS